MSTNSYSVSVLDLEQLSKSEELLEEYSLLIPPKYRGCLEGKEPDGISSVKIIAVGLTHSGEPAGIALAGCYEDTGLAEFYCLKIKEEHRSLPLGKELLSKLEEECFKTDAVIINHNFRMTESDSPFNQGVLSANAWSEPKLIMERYFYEGFTFNPPWYGHPPKLPAGYKIFFWKNLKPSERIALQLEQREGRFTALESPFQDEERIEKMNSLGLRYKGRVVGWYITHRIAPDTIRYTILYVDPEIRLTGIPMRLGVESAKIQQKSSVRWGLFELNLEYSSPSWKKFIKRRFAPYALYVDKIFQTWKAKGPEVFTI